MKSGAKNSGGGCTILWIYNSVCSITAMPYDQVLAIAHMIEHH